MRFIKLNICIALSCYLFTACSNDDEKWEPEMVVPLAFFEVDVTQHLQIGSAPTVEEFIIDFFSTIPSSTTPSSDWQTLVLKEAIIWLQDSAKTAEESLPESLSAEMWHFYTDEWWASRGAEPLLKDLLSAFRSNGDFFVINNFAYKIVTAAAKLDSKLKPKLTGDSVNFSNEITIDKGDFSKNIEQIRRIELQLDVRSLLDVTADVQIVMLGSDNAPLDNFKVTLPVYGKNEKSPQVHAYEQGEARDIIQRLDKIVLNVSSKKLGLTLEKIKDLHDKKISVIVGLKIKTAINDNNAGE
jgi:hypothetical protein